MQRSSAREPNISLHDQLYTGPVTKELRLDLPFIPHVGIANTRKPSDCKKIVDQLNAQEFDIRGRVESLDVIGYDGKRVWTIEQLLFPDDSEDPSGDEVASLRR